MLLGVGIEVKGGARSAQPQGGAQRDLAGNGRNRRNAQPCRAGGPCRSARQGTHPGKRRGTSEGSERNERTIVRILRWARLSARWLCWPRWLVAPRLRPSPRLFESFTTNAPRAYTVGGRSGFPRSRKLEEDTKLSAPKNCRIIAAVLMCSILSAVGVFAQTIANVTNAALPGLDLPPGTAFLAPRSLATIWGINLADTTASTAPPWKTTLGGLEVHLTNDTCFDSSCDLIAPLLYVSPTQINFLVPDDGSAECVLSDTGYACGPIGYRIVFIRDGQRIDSPLNNSECMPGGNYTGCPGYVYIDNWYNATYNVVFQVGYDCLYSYTQVPYPPAACGVSGTQGQYKAPLGAVTDALTGQLIYSGNPVHQGQIITLWLTAVYGGVALNSATGLMTAQFPVTSYACTYCNLSWGFTISQMGSPVRGAIFTVMWAGESPQFVGLDQVNATFPACLAPSPPVGTGGVEPPATTEQRYDVFLSYENAQTLTTGQIYMPFVVRPGDPDCSAS